LEEHEEFEMNAKMMLLASVLLMVLVLPSVNAQNYPTWIQDMAGWYGDGSIDDAEYTKSLQFLIDEGILKVQQKIVYVDVIKEIEIIKEVQGSEANLDAVWEAINFNAEEIRETVKFNPTADLYSRFNDIETQIMEAKNASHDNTVKLQSERTVAPHTHLEYEQKYDQLWEMYIQLGERVLELEKEALK
jgi:hypothetical protein